MFGMAQQFGQLAQLDRLMSAGIFGGAALPSVPR